MKGTEMNFKAALGYAALSITAIGIPTAAAIVLAYKTGKVDGRIEVWGEVKKIVTEFAEKNPPKTIQN